uniref:Uncharacterized protein n=1 Tax=Rhizophora mucronata TaxID=61149 RepID=A0A2P2QJC8_RHIMU
MESYLEVSESPFSLLSFNNAALLTLFLITYY